MERSDRLVEFWNWLPAFRAVAETQHLPSASAKLRVSPSALSRTIRLLETNLGRPLFTRVGRQISLNPDGESFLASVRDAMRLIDDGLSALADHEMSGPVRVYCSRPMGRVFLTDALCELQTQHPELVPSLRDVEPPRVTSALLRGEIDVAFVADDVTDTARLEIHRIGALTHAVYACPSHPAVGAETIDALAESCFVSPWPEPTSELYEGWPPEKPRRVVMHVSTLEDAIDAAVARRLLVVLPVVFAEQHRDDTVLQRLPCVLGSRMNIYALRRPASPQRDKAQEVIEAARSILRSRDSG
ncbi:MAG: LysR family transcriptional regulator [Myxococcota bacterium]